MYSICVVLVVVLSAGRACQPPPCHWSDPTPAINYFKAVANKVMLADKKQQMYCQSGGAYVKEKHTPGSYSLMIPVSGAAEVEVLNRVLMVLPAGCSDTVWDVRVLPAYVDGYRGQYCVSDGMLTLNFPYKYNPLVGGGYACEALRRDTAKLTQVQSTSMFSTAAGRRRCGAFGCGNT